MTTTADELRTAAAKVRDLATRTLTTLDRNEIQWTDLTVADRAIASPMVWSQYAAAMGPNVGTLLADWLDTAAANADALTWPNQFIERALATARAINATARTAT